jgi:hypothetical protein
MAQRQVRPIQNMVFCDSRRSIADYAGGTASENRTVNAPANLLSVAELKAFLSGYDAFTYTASVLNVMTTNDLLYAARSIDSSNVKSIADYMTQQVARSS